MGTQPLNPSMMLPAWIHIEPPTQVREPGSPGGNARPSPALVTVTSCLQPVGVQLVGIQTSPNDHFLWAIDNRGTVFVRTGLCEEMPVGTGWEMVPGMVPPGPSAGAAACVYSVVHFRISGQSAGHQLADSLGPLR